MLLHPTATHCGGRNESVGTAISHRPVYHRVAREYLPENVQVKRTYHIATTKRYP